MNDSLTKIPSHDEIKQADFNLKKDSALGPDGFGGVFYHTFWPIILLKYNSNTIILLPKTNDVDTMNMFRLISLANFKFKIISKIIGDKLSIFMSTLVPIYQMGIYIRGCIYIASEATNHLDNKVFGRNITLKVEIPKAFYTICWEFLLYVLKRFGFNCTFYSWIQSILT